MRSSHSLDRLETAFDDDRLVAGLLLPATPPRISVCSSSSTPTSTSGLPRVERTSGTSC